MLAASVGDVFDEREIMQHVRSVQAAHYIIYIYTPNHCLECTCSEDSGLATKTAAQNIQPGQYKADRDFVSDTTREVSKNIDARFRKSPGLLGFCIE